MKKVWFEVWAWRKEMDKPELVAKVKSEGLANIVVSRLADIYDVVGSDNFVHIMAQSIKEEKAKK